MATQSLDLVYELQVELGWSPDFAATAHSEYMRWLRLRAQSGDFQYCKLPPSRAVGTVWGLHRQWTQDYEKTCTSLGGFIHHFPPAMRMNIAREEAYAATLHTYKALFGDEPPVSHWGPAICTYKPLSSNGVTHVPASSKDPPPRALPSLRRSPTKRDASALTAPTTPTKGKRANAEARRASSTKSSAIGNTVDRSRAALENAKNQRRSPKSGTDARRIDLPAQDTVMEDGEHPPRSPGRPRKRFSGPSPLYVLKPLRPGEKRKRGRPSFTDYVLATSLSLSRTNADPKKKDVKSAVEKTTTVKSPGGTHSLRRRKGASSGKVPTPSPGIVKKERPHKPFRRVARWSEASKVGDFNKTASLNPPAVAATPSGEQKKEGQQTQGTPGPGKRPRGRPRKDGSWPIPRIRKPEAASKPAPTVPQKSTMNENEQKKAQEAQEAEVKNAGSGSPAPPEETTNEVPAQVPPRETPETPSSAPAPASLPATSNGSSGFAPPPGPPAQDANPMPNVSGDAAAEQSGVSEAPHTETAPMPESTEVSAQKQASPVEDPLAPEAVETPVPSKVVEGRDIQVQDLTDKDVSKSTPVHDHLPRGGVFEQIMDGSVLVDKDRQGDISNSLSGRDVRMGQDVAFPQTETIRDPAEIEIQLSTSRPESIPNLPGTTSDIIPTAQSSEKLMQQTGTFGMNPMNIVPAVSGPLDSSMLSIGAASVQPRVDGEGDKDVDISLEEGDPKKPFKRPRGRPRKDGSWPISRTKTLGEEAVERVKDMGEAPLNFPVGPSGTV